MNMIHVYATFCGGRSDRNNRSKYLVQKVLDICLTFFRDEILTRNCSFFLDVCPDQDSSFGSGKSVSYTA